VGVGVNVTRRASADTLAGGLSGGWNEGLELTTPWHGVLPATKGLRPPTSRSRGCDGE